jgi:hypothetical protein
MPVPKLHLAINHLIFLTKDERYALFNGTNIETVGVTIPVWFWLGNTTEPAKEIFCKYLITNQPTSDTIDLWDGGYKINTPQQDKMDEIPPKIKEVVAHKSVGSAKNLLDIKDGGSQWLQYKVFKKFKAVGVTHPIRVVHTIEMKPMENLTTTLST